MIPIARLTAGGLLASALLAVAACSGGGGDGAPAASASTSSGPSASASATAEALDRVQVAQASARSVPTLTFPTPLRVDRPADRVIRAGTGTTITAEHKVVANYLLVDGRDGKPRVTAWRTRPVTLPIGQIPQFAALIGQRVGARMLFAIPATQAVGPQGDEQLGIKADDTLLYLIEPTSASAPLTSAEGTPVPPKPGLPTVRMGATPKDPAVITVPRSAPPTRTIAQPLVTGRGPKVVAGQTVRVTYTGVTWRDPSHPFDFSGRTPQGFAEFQVGAGKLIKAWDEQIVGRTVGTRLLLVVPPADGYGPKGMGDKIKGTDTLVFVLDILDAS